MTLGTLFQWLIIFTITKKKNVPYKRFRTEKLQLNTFENILPIARVLNKKEILQNTKMKKPLGYLVAISIGIWPFQWPQ